MVPGLSGFQTFKGLLHAVPSPQPRGQPPETQRVSLSLLLHISHPKPLSLIQGWEIKHQVSVGRMVTGIWEIFDSVLFLCLEEL